MPYAIDETHDPKLESWVESANDPETDFPIQNLPLCVIAAPVEIEGEPDAMSVHPAMRIGEMVVVLDMLAHFEIVDGSCDDWRWLFVEDLAAQGLSGRIRKIVQNLLLKDNPTLRDHPDRDQIVVPAEAVSFGMPLMDLGDYTDFYASVYHATNVGSMFRPDNPLLPNYKWIPVGYHGRASSIVPSGTPIVRPWGQTIQGDVGSESRPTHAPCKMLDYELEMGVIIGRGNELGRPITMAEAEEHILGLCLLNDWSARDVQKWEYQPLGPFLAKNFATTVSPYIVTMEALAPFRCGAMERPSGDPQPLPHLDSAGNREAGGFDITLEVHLASKQMRDRGLSPVRLSKGNFRDMYWTVAQMIAHHTSNGCNLQPGDLLGSGTISGPTRDSRGCLLELTWDGDPWVTPPVVKPTTARTPITLPTGETRRFLEDGDEVVIKGYCDREGFRRIGFGECRGVIQPAVR